MKKLALALMCFASVAFFASCTKPVENPEPSIAVMTGENYVTGTVENPTIIDATDASALNYKIGFHVESNAQTKKELSTLKITFSSIDADGTYSFDTIIDLSGKTSYDYSELLFPQDEREIYLEATVTDLVTDVDNKTNTASIAFKLDIPAQPLFARPIEWVRKGANLEATLKTKWQPWVCNGLSATRKFSPPSDLLTRLLCMFATATTMPTLPPIWKRMNILPSWPKPELLLTDIAKSPPTIAPITTTCWPLFTMVRLI